MKETKTNNTVAMSDTEKRNAFSAEMPIQLKMPSGYTMTENGVFHKAEDSDKTEHICRNPILITKVSISATTKAELFDIAFCKNGEWRTTTVARSELSRPTGIINTLGGIGCSITARNAHEVIEYLIALEDSNLQTIPTVKATDCCGWINEREFVPFNAPNYEFDRTLVKPEFMEGLSQKGTLEGWVNDMGKYRANNTFRFIMSAALAAPLLDIVGSRSFIVYNWCTSGKGKTAAMHGALSAWGNPEKLACSFNATQVGLERMASFFNDIPMGLDERQSAGNGQGVQAYLEKIVYMLSNGTGRLRGEKTGGVQAVKNWKTVVLATGEEPIVVSSTQDGVVNRSIELTNAPFDDRVSAGRIYRESTQNYGHAAVAFIDAIVRMGRDEVEARYNTFYDAIRESGLTDNYSHIGYTAVVATADYILSRYVFDIAEQEADVLALEMARKVLAENQVNSKRDVNMEALEAIKEWIVANRSSFDGYASKSSQFHTYGFYNEAAKEMCIYPSALKDFLTKSNFSEGKTLQYLKENGIIKAEPGKNTVKRMCHGEKVRVVCFNWLKMTDEDQSTGSPYAQVPYAAQVTTEPLGVPCDDWENEIPFPEIVEGTKAA